MRKISRIQLCGAAALIGIFITDLLTPPGIAIGALYTLVVYLVVKGSIETITFFSIASAALIWIKLLAYGPAAFTLPIIANRCISVLVIAVIAVIAMKRKKVFFKRNRERGEYVIFLEKLLAATSHKVRGSVSSCIGLVDLIVRLEREGKTCCESHKYFEYLKEKATELDFFTRDLTTSIYQMKKQKEEKNLQVDSWS